MGSALGGRRFPDVPGGPLARIQGARLGSASVADAFVSYSRRDSDFVQRLAASIEGQGRSVWLDTEGLADGEVFPQALRSAIDASDSFLFVITPDSVNSAYCEQ